MESIGQIKGSTPRRQRCTQCPEYFEAFYLYSASPVLAGVRPAVLVKLLPSCLPVWRAQQNRLHSATGLCTREITNLNGSTLLLIYDDAAMRSRLACPQAQSFLRCHGYPAGSAEAAFNRLQERFTQESCPHEIGIFLGYPLEDVRGFIDNKGKNCICCRYWKVYHDAEQAQRMFRQIDEAQHYAMHLLGSSLPVHVAAKMLRRAC